MEKQSETKARQAIASDDSGISNYHLAFCQTYPTTAKSFMSYHEWNPKKLISLIRQFSDKVNMIIGTEDVRLKQSWRDQLERENIPVTYIPGANHFFDQTHEFDLSEAVENLLE